MRAANHQLALGSAMAASFKWILVAVPCLLLAFGLTPTAAQSATTNARLTIPAVSQLLARHPAGNSEDALRDLAVAIQRDHDLVRDLVETLMGQVEDCAGASSDVPYDHEVESDLTEEENVSAEDVEDDGEVLVSSHRLLQTTSNATVPNPTTYNATVAKHRRTLQGLITLNNRRARAQRSAIGRLAAQFAALRNITLSNQGLVIGFGGNASSSIEINTATTVVDAVQRRVGTASASLPSMRVVVGTFSTDVINAVTTIQSQTNVLDSAQVSVSQLNEAITDIQTSLTSLEPAASGNTNKLVTVESKLNANRNTTTNLSSNVTVISDAANALEQDAIANAAKLACVRTPTAAGEFTISGCNVRVLNGAGSTDTVNGKGNLVIGFNEDGACEGNADGSCLRGGSHNLVLGRQNQYQSFAGIVVGTENQVAGNYSTVTSGFRNKAMTLYASVSGGVEGGALTAEAVSVSGGFGNFANGYGATVSGGNLGIARADLSTVTGGSRVVASTRETVVP